MKSGGRMSGREERICPSLMKVGPSSARVSRNRRAEVARISSREGRSPGSRRPSTSQMRARSHSSPKPWRTTTLLISRRRLRSWTAWITRRFFSQGGEQIHLHEDAVAVRDACGAESTELASDAGTSDHSRLHVVAALVRVDQIEGRAGAPLPTEDQVEVEPHLLLVVAGVLEGLVGGLRRAQLVELDGAASRFHSRAQPRAVIDPGGEELAVRLQGEVRGEGVGGAQGCADAARLLRGEDVEARLVGRPGPGIRRRRIDGPAGIGLRAGLADLADGSGALGVGKVEAPVELRQRPEHQCAPELVQPLEAREGAALGPVELHLEPLARVGGHVPEPLERALPLDGSAVGQLAVVQVGREEIEACLEEPERVGVHPRVDEQVAVEQVAEGVVVQLAQSDDDLGALPGGPGVHVAPSCKSHCAEQVRALHEPQVIDVEQGREEITMDAEDAGVPEPPRLGGYGKAADVSSRKVPSRSVPAAVPVTPASPASPSGVRRRSTEVLRISVARMLVTRAGTQLFPDGSQVAGCSTCAKTRGSMAVSSPTLARLTLPVSFTAARTGTNGCW